MGPGEPKTRLGMWKGQREAGPRCLPSQFVAAALCPLPALHGGRALLQTSGFMPVGEPGRPRGKEQGWKLFLQLQLPRTISLVCWGHRGLSGETGQEG